MFSLYNSPPIFVSQCDLEMFRIVVQRKKSIVSLATPYWIIQLHSTYGSHSKCQRWKVVRCEAEWWWLVVSIDVNISFCQMIYVHQSLTQNERYSTRIHATEVVKKKTTPSETVLFGMEVYSRSSRIRFTPRAIGHTKRMHNDLLRKPLPTWRPSVEYFYVFFFSFFSFWQPFRIENSFDIFSQITHNHIRRTSVFFLLILFHRTHI